MACARELRAAPHTSEHAPRRNSAEGLACDRSGGEALRAQGVHSEPRNAARSVGLLYGYAGQLAMLHGHEGAKEGSQAGEPPKRGRSPACPGVVLAPRPLLTLAPVQASFRPDSCHAGPSRAQQQHSGHSGQDGHPGALAEAPLGPPAARADPPRRACPSSSVTMRRVPSRLKSSRITSAGSSRWTPACLCTSSWCAGGGPGPCAASGVPLTPCPAAGGCGPSGRPAAD